MIARKLDHAYASVRGPVVDREPNRECERVEPPLMAARPGRRDPADCCLTPQDYAPRRGYPRSALSAGSSCLRSLPQTCRKHFGIGLMFLVNSQYHGS